MEESYVLHLQQQYQTFKELYLCYCGYAHCEPLHSYGPAVRPNYLLHCILDGKGVYQINGVPHTLGKGDGFLIEPNKQTFYQADAQNPWTYLWIGFAGTNAEGCLRAIGLDSEHLVFRCADNDRLLELVKEMLRHNTMTTQNDFLLQSLLCEFFACLAAGISSRADRLSQADRENLYVHKAVEYIRNNYASGITVNDVAHYVALHRSYLFALFQKVLHISPQEYLTLFRLTRAKEELTLTDTSVANIAVNCGYQDPQVFTKAFKNKFGITPLKYRKADRENARQNLKAMLDEEPIPGLEDDEAPADSAAVESDSLDGALAAVVLADGAFGKDVSADAASGNRASPSGVPADGGETEEQAAD